MIQSATTVLTVSSSDCGQQLRKLVLSTYRKGLLMITNAWLILNRKERHAGAKSLLIVL
jgi:hypothetical protein